MSDMSAEEFAQRVQGVGLIEFEQMEAIWSEIGTRNIPLENLISFLHRKDLLTNMQLERLKKKQRDGYFYGKNKLLYVVGKGTFARVYRAAHVETGRVYAVKVLRAQYSRDPLQRDRFLAEAKMVMPLRHVNIVPIYEVGDEKDRPYMVMEFVEGQNLRDFVRVRKRFDVNNSLRILIDIVSGLEYALSKGVTHRDLKLSNVLITSTGRGKLVDFGLAAISAVARGDPSAKTPNPRSIDYAGLERITGVKKDDPRSDIYFAGCMLYHMLSGEPPLLETKDRTQRLSVSRFREVKPITQHMPDLPGPIITLVNRAMDLDVERRFATPGEFLAELKAAQYRIQQGDSAHDDGPVDGGKGPKALDREGESRRVMIVESSAEMQDALRDLLKRRGYRVLVIGDAQRALARFEDPEPPCDCIIFCTTDMGQAALDAFNQFGEQEHTTSIPAVLFISENHQELAKRAATSEHRVLLFMPLKVRQLRTILLKLLSGTSASADS
ncbi:MAG: protein kinase [Pirellulaceae bacterium]